MRADAPAFPRAAFSLAPLRGAAEGRGSDDFSPMWAGQAFALAQAKSAAEVTADLMGEATKG
jgi:nitronate monooxygenase